MQDHGVKARDILRALAIRHEADFFITECKTGPTQVSNGKPLYRIDGVAIKKSWTNPKIIGYEVKVSRSDFLGDSKFFSYLEYCHQLYIVCPTRMIDRTELPDSIGLMYFDPAKQQLSIRKNSIFRDIEIDADMLWYIIMNKLSNDRWPFEGKKAEYFRAWVEGRRDTKSLGHMVSAKLLAENAQLQKQLDSMHDVQKTLDDLREIDKVMHEQGVSPWGGTRAERLREALRRTMPEGVDTIERCAQSILREIEKAKEADHDTALGV